MHKIDWNTAAGLIDFSGKQAVSASLARQQLDGTVALHNMLSNEDGVAYLADEVGMGKTYIALGVVALMRRFQPALRVLYLLPKNNVRDKWQKDYNSFIDKNYRLNDGVVKGFGNAPAAPFRLCGSLSDLLQAVATDSARDYFICTSAFSLSLGETHTELDVALDQFRRLLPQNAPQVDVLAAALARSKGDASALPDLKLRVKHCWASALNAILPRFDLVVVDEAHNYRRGIETSDRNRLLATVLGTLPEDKSLTRRVARLLLLSATPFDRDIEQLRRQLQLFGKKDALKVATGANWAQVHAALAPFMVRRLNSLTFDETVHTRNMYRTEHRSGPEAEITLELHQQLFAALLQKKVSESLHENHNGKFELGMLASFESYLPSNHNQPVLFDGIDERRGPSGDGDAADRTVVEWLVSDYNSEFGKFPPHPKMDDVASRAADAAFCANKKQLIFVRRVGSVGELKAKLEDHYNQWIGDYIAADGEVAHWFREYTSLARRRESGRLDDEQDGETANLSSFFAWFYRGTNDALAQAGARLQPTPFNYRSTLASSSAMFATNWSTLPGMPPVRDVDFDALDSLLPLPSSPTRAQYFERAQHAYLRAVATGNSAASRVASRILAVAFDDAGGVSGPVDSAALVEAAGQHTLWEAVRAEPALAALAREWSSATFDVMAGEDGNAADQAIRHVMVHHRLTAAVCRLDHPFIDLYALRASRGNTGDEGSADDKLTQAFASLLLRQSGQPVVFSSFTILRDLAANLALVLKQNFEDALKKPAGELTTYLTRQLQPLSPILGATGSNSASRSAIARKFRMPGYPRVLVSTDVFQEGEDLHTFCDSVIHYGISASPIGLEQKVGRVDRIASLSHRNMASAGTAPQAHFIQVRFPHIRESLEFLQVRQAARNLNQFLLTMNRIGDAAPQSTVQIDLERDLQDTNPIEKPLLTRLESPFAITTAALEGINHSEQVTHAQRAFDARIAHAKCIVEERVHAQTGTQVTLAPVAGKLVWQGPAGQRVALHGAQGRPHLLLSMSMPVPGGFDMVAANDLAAAAYLSKLQANPLVRLQLAADRDQLMPHGLRRNAEIYAGAVDILSALEVDDVYRRVNEPGWQGVTLIAGVPNPAGLIKGLTGLSGVYRITAGSDQTLTFHFDLEQRQQDVQWQVFGNYLLLTAQVLSVEQTDELARHTGQLLANTLVRNAAFDMVDFHIDSNLALAVRALHPLGHLDQEELAFAAALVAGEADRLRQIMFADPAPDDDGDADRPVKQDNSWRLWAEDNDAMCKMRALLSEQSWLESDLIRQTAYKLGYQKASPQISHALQGVLRAAVRRGVAERQNGKIVLHCRSIEDYTDDHLKDQFMAAIRREGSGWISRELAVRAFARWMGYAKVGSNIESIGASLITKLLRAKRLASAGSDIRHC